MCSPISCARCQKVTWTGCGEHIEQALAGFSQEQICACDAGKPAGINTY